ncbi:DUF916 and DUF3324 domain-containing protein [Lacticaseibacillus sp. N501-2]|uniref:DUF916 and DUF3324 domain-containing protein n=1 Tax=Lacticaseibacillus salsurae TaxID=3367729 RepID=UPI0038B417A8
MRKLNKWLVAVFTLVMVSLIGTQSVKAANTQAVPLSVIPVTNKYQVNVNSGFYDLEMKPGQSTEILVKLANSGKKALTVNLQTVASTTDASSHISYTEANKPYDSSSKYPVPTLFNIPKSYSHLTIPAYTTALFHMPMTMPKEQFKGILLGALRVTPVVKKSKTAGIHNTYGYSVAIRLSNGIDTQPDLRLKQVKVNHNYAGTNVDATLQNFKPAMLRSGKIDTRVTKRGQNRTLKALEINKASAAPNSTWTVSTPWDGSVAPGDYTLHVTYTSTDPQFSGTKVWKFSRNFHISTVDAARYNLTQMNIPWWVYAILAVIVLLLIIVIILLIKRRKEAKRRVEE